MSNEKCKVSVADGEQEFGQVETFEVELDFPTHGMRMRDQTHSIGAKSQTKMRSRLAMNQLQSISGVGRSKAEVLYDGGYRSIDDVQKASQEELNDIPEIGNALAARIKADVGEHHPFDVDPDKIIYELEEEAKNNYDESEITDEIEDTKFLEQGTLMYGME